LVSGAPSIASRSSNRSQARVALALSICADPGNVFTA
jgi:hypothetical protein